MNAKLLSLTALAALWLAPQAQAARYVLDFGVSEVVGFDQINLKQEISRRYRGADLRDEDLTQVTLVSKSANNQGLAILNVGGLAAAQAVLPIALPGDYNYDAAHTFQSTRLIPRNISNDNGAWQLMIRGRVKYTRVVVDTRGAANGGIIVRPVFPDLPFQKIADMHVDEGDTETKYVAINGLIRGVKLEARAERNYVQRAEVELMDGRRVLLSALQGNLQDEGSPEERAVELIDSTGRAVAVRSLILTVTCTARDGTGKIDISILR